MIRRAKWATAAIPCAWSHHVLACMTLCKLLLVCSILSGLIGQWVQYAMGRLLHSQCVPVMLALSRTRSVLAKWHSRPPIVVLVQAACQLTSSLWITFKHLVCSNKRAHCFWMVTGCVLSVFLRAWSKDQQPKNSHRRAIEPHIYMLCERGKSWAMSVFDFCLKLGPVVGRGKKRKTTSMY